MSNETCFVSSRAALEIAKNANEDSVILIGQTGGGKSSIGNALLGFSISIEQSDREFPEGRSLTAMTDELKVVAGRFLESGEELTVIDTPGFFFFFFFFFFSFPCFFFSLVTHNIISVQVF